MQAEEGGHASPISPLPSAFAKAAGSGEGNQGHTKLSGQKRRLKAHRESLPAQHQPGQQDAEPEGLQDEPLAAGGAARDAVCQGMPWQALVPGNALAGSGARECPACCMAAAAWCS